MAPGPIDALSAAISVEQIFSRCVAAVLIQREISRAPDPDAELGRLTEQIHQAIDFYDKDRPTPADLLDRDKEMARLHVDAVASIVSVLRKI